VDLDAGQAGNDWFGFHGIILTEWLLTLPVWCNEDEMCAVGGPKMGNERRTATNA
jgi:NAD(P)H-flavin reductase